MINEVRNTVLSIINKDNNGFITPDQFNYYADIAQKEVFEGYFHDYSRAVNKRNAHMHTSGYGDVTERLEEVISGFAVYPGILAYSNEGFFIKPTDAYMIGTVTLSDGVTIVEKVPNDKIAYLRQSLDTAPSTEYPVYTLNEDGLTVYPTTINAFGQVIMNYIRYPKTPKWTYTSISGGEPFFNNNPNIGYQDFELPESDKFNLITRILQYAGVEIREPQVVQMAKTEEVQQKTEQQ
jgi:hypothetical protein